VKENIVFSVRDCGGVLHKGEPHEAVSTSDFSEHFVLCQNAANHFLLNPHLNNDSVCH